MLDFFFFTVDLTCINKHDDFEVVVLLKSTVWFALVALHDREICRLERREMTLPTGSRNCLSFYGNRFW